MISDLVFDRAMELCEDKTSEQLRKLRVLCNTYTISLKEQLREGVQPEDIEDPFCTAVSLYALSALEGLKENMGEFRAGDLTVKQGNGSQRQKDLQRQAELLMRPYLQDSFQFMGV